MPERFGKRPTLRTIAEKSGLAVATVSRALSDAPDIGTETKNRVRQLAAELGYVPNRAGLRLRTGKTNVVALLVMADEDLTDHTALLAGAIAKSLMETVYQLSVVTYSPEGDPLAPLQQLIDAQAVDAVIFGQTLINDPRITYMQEANFPCVTFGRTQMSGAHAYFDFDNVVFARDAVARLHTAGRRHVLLMPPTGGLHCTRDLITGGQAEAQRLGIGFSVLEAATVNDSTAVMSAALRQFLADHPETDGVITPSARSTDTVLKEIEGMGLRSGQDIDVVAKENRALTTRLRPELLYMWEDLTLAGEFLAQAAIKAIECPGDPPMQQLARGEWQPG